MCKDQHGREKGNTNCKHIESGLYCCCYINNAECLICKGWFTPEEKPKQTWEDLQKELIKKVNEQNIETI